jgi:peptidylprolyl isomerase
MASLTAVENDYIDISGDGGVLKLLLRASNTRVEQQTNPLYSEWQIKRQEEQAQGKPQSAEAPAKFISVTIVPEPCTPGTCQCHYTGTLERNGEEFDTSRKFGSAYSSPFKFNVGEGIVVKGFDIAVLSMMTGERAQFKLRSDYAYGDVGIEGEGMSPDILPGDTLIFDLELITVGVQSAKDERLIKEERRLAEIKAQRTQADLEKQLKKEERTRKKEQTEKDRKEKLRKKKDKGRKEKKKETKDDGVDIGGSLTKKAVQKMKPKELKENLKKLGESIQGNKKELIAKLLEKLRL